MKITTFNPQIFTKDAASVEKIFEELGFEKHHDRKDIGDLKVEGIRMKDPNGFYLDISQPDYPLPRDMVGIRMNVDDFDEAYEFLKDHGFKDARDNNITDTKSSRSAVMISQTGFSINLVQHIKN